jgi:hypothetical protein
MINVVEAATVIVMARLRIEFVMVSAPGLV